MSAPTNGQVFEEAIKVTPLGSHRYSATLRDEWCIGTGMRSITPSLFLSFYLLSLYTVPHGGYSTAVLYRLATTHFAHTHPKLYDSPATPISIQLSFLRRTGAGPAVLTVQDTKLGARTSIIHVTLSQVSEKKAPPGTPKDQLEEKITGYITVSPATAEVGISARTAWTLHPPAPSGTGPDGRVNLSNLGKTGRDGNWVLVESPFPKFRRAALQTEIYSPDPKTAPKGPRVVDQWSRFRPGGDKSARWTNEALVYLMDMFPMALDGFDTMEEELSGSGEQKPAKFWYPTVTMNVDLKKRLPAQGPEWLYSRVQTKVVRDGRTDLDVTVLDEQGEVVALGNQVGLVLSSARNVGKRTLKQKL